ncbi:hypothetical protein L21SP2_2901 [Salinispira pacifica]|uniref:Uncharacterized protein n=1 Tax=Salinispira pacifica TaxID=1307761 RepID=V5WL19_9SPIO|nr:hypothetical protein L21SP2_2901 [Salinispira pacifica]
MEPVVEPAAGWNRQRDPGPRTAGTDRGGGSTVPGWSRRRKKSCPGTSGQLYGRRPAGETCLFLLPVVHQHFSFSCIMCCT